MDIPELLQAAKSDLDRLSMIYERYPDTDFSDYSIEDRREVRALQANIRGYEAVLRQAARNGVYVRFGRVA